MLAFGRAFELRFADDPVVPLAEWGALRRRQQPVVRTHYTNSGSGFIEL
jgi:hypothetical protein